MDRATESTRRILDLEAGINFRELGGYQTTSGQSLKYHKVLRSAGLGDLTQKDIKYLQDYGVKTDVDFRSQDEINKKPDRVPNGAKYVSLPVFSEDQTEASKIGNEVIPEIDFDPHDGYNHMLDVYRNMIVEDTARNAYRQFFDELLGNSNDNDVVLFHCTAGKDRTGMGAVFFLYTLGVPLPTIKEDYLLTNQASKVYVANVLKQVEAKDPTLVESIRALLTVNENYLNVAQKAIEETSGSLDNYIKNELKVSNHEIDDLKKIYLLK
ncbi:tyrosine-protein phosphatase [Companilactobacillus sp.]|jgi:protein-tyrosine phosphatase|uniref:tyrosine-protein phosphatase n=1 Tax=Companilactobacillus sp. TaxID=2767905 RepID=UPI0025B9BF5B|nr:tyrosine-protein phosphatase [Companilactobacillus sp.]MCH4009851.1 tyrosine-protein phosphatase [Companilactobacillus sp.]MCH4052473.1 tyrosine-protein phosphatase [Companilactobacillus sp.]MCH4077793.1 tyrosine-protein phosphatase [Companilactobacillus sp.]MCH4126369.1 tyrosine-protein phosphatase [Companilactobacillus sp.]MCI1312691.1 tyrosine-protein phosphatase [Companilactobacillus sp.]